MANRNAIHILKNTLFPSQVLPASAYYGEPLVNLGDGIVFFSGSTDGSPTWVPSNNNAGYFEVGSNLYNLKIRNKITHYNNLTNLAGKFLSGTTTGFVLADITNIQGVDNYVTGGTYSNGTLTLNRQNGSVTVNGLLSADTYVTGFTYSNNNLTILQNQGQSPLTVNISTMTGLTVNGTLSASTYYGDGSHLTGLITTDTYTTGFTYDNSNVLTIKRNEGLPDLNTKIENIVLTALTVNNTQSNVVTIGQGGMVIGSGGSSASHGIGDLTVHGSLIVYGTGTTIETSELYIEDPNITINYNPSGSSTSTSVGSGFIIQDGSGVANSNSNFLIGQLYLNPNINSNTEYTSANGNANRGFFTQLNDIIIRNTNYNSGAPNGKRVLTEDDILDGGVY